MSGSGLRVLGSDYRHLGARFIILCTGWQSGGGERLPKEMPFKRSSWDQMGRVGSRARVGGQRPGLSAGSRGPRPLISPWKRLMFVGC